MPGGGAEYARLPVTELADDLTSDDEDDLYTRPPRRHHSTRAGKQAAKPGLHGTPSAFREAATRPVKRYQLLDEEDALGVLQASTPDVRVRNSLCTPKKTCLALSCLLILTGLSVAIWLVPCQWYGCRDPGLQLQQSSSRRDYEVMFPGIVVTTALVVTPTVYLDSPDVLFGFRIQDSAAGGVMVVASSSGNKIWQQDLYEAPTDLQCGGVDLNSNGIFECLATGSSSMMALINMDKREVEWYLHEHNSSVRPQSLLPPLLLADLTSDGVADVLTAGLLRPETSHDRGHQPPRSQLIITDGATGRVLARGPVTDCPVLLSLTAGETPSDVTLECMSPQSGVAPRTESLTALTAGLRTDDMPEEVFSLTSGSSDSQSLQVQLENSGVCPRCRGRLTLLDASGAAVWSTSVDRARLHSVQQFDHRNRSGVVYKLWQYPPQDQASSGYRRRHRRWWRTAPEEDAVPTLTFEEAASVTQSSRGIEFKYEKPGLDWRTPDAAWPAVTPEPDDGSEPEFFTESAHVVLPTADGEVAARQLDSVQITRFCRGQQHCQPPALADNTATAAVLDVGGDGGLDLVTLTSLYVPEGDVVIPRHRHQCSLQTRLRKRQLNEHYWRETASHDTMSETVQDTMSENVPDTMSETGPTQQLTP